MVKTVLRTVDPSVPVRLVRATRGKRVRAEPVAALYEQGRVRHLSPLPDLVDQLTTWTPDDPTSPDRLDALVWAMTELDLSRPAKVRGVAAPRF
jgi:phage terminase large subunit-like protein